MKLNDHRSACWRAALILMLTCVLWLPPSRGANANPPERMSYQGFVADANGVVLGNDSPRNYTAIFQIYSAATGGTALWVEQQTITVDKGYFSVLLGEGSVVSGQPRPDLSSIFTGASASERYVGITVRGLAATDVEIAPRLQLLAAPYAFLARNAVALVNDQGAPFVNISSGTLAAIGIGAPIQSTGSGGNARGSGAVDLQVRRGTDAGAPTRVASGETSAIGGGINNRAAGKSSTVAGGEGNAATAYKATVSGGASNTASADNATVGGGLQNTASGVTSTVAGGDSNVASAQNSTVGGGGANTASGQRSTVPGGLYNVAAGNDSFAAGRRAKANHNGSFVWADSVDADFASDAVNQFRVRATGGAQILGARSTAVTGARQLLVGDKDTGGASGVALGLQHEPNVSWSGVIQALGGGGPINLQLNPAGGTVVVGGTLQVNGGLTGGGSIPVGGIIMWSGAINAIPTGWRLCDGGGGTPDLRDRFVVGAGSGYAVGARGGNANVTLSVNQMPSHSHTYLDTWWAEVDGSDTTFGRVTGSRTGSDYDNFPLGNTRTSNATGGGQAVDVRPPFYALAFIMRVQ